MDKQEKDAACCTKQGDKPLDQAYWNAQWEARQTGWDIGYASPAITEYMKQYTRKDAAILIPGCGNAYEAEFLATNGFTDITLIDIAPAAVERLQEKFAAIPQVRVICGDFFEHEGSYDLMIEQTFFCAIAPAKRKDYVMKAAALLKAGGHIAGLLFNRNFEQQGPPFGGDVAAYRQLFEPYFIINKMDICHNSIPPRANTEVFINLLKK